MRLLGASTRPNPPACECLDIKLTNAVQNLDLILLPHPSNPTCVSPAIHGAVTCSLREDMAILAVTVRLDAKCSIWFTEQLENRHPRSYRQTIPLVKSGTQVISYAGPGGTKVVHSLAAGPHEFPFVIKLPEGLPQSIEGLDGARITYTLHATIERPSFVSNISVKKVVRLIPELPIDTFDFDQSADITAEWRGKADYNIIVHKRGLAIGSRVAVSINVTSLQKGLYLQVVECYLCEHKTLMVNNNGPSHARHHLSTRNDLDYFIVEEAGSDLNRWKITGWLELPNSLKKCCPTIETEHVAVKHKVHVVFHFVAPPAANEQKPEVLQLRVKLPVLLYIAPQRLPDESESSPARDYETNSRMESVLPTYHDRKYDPMLWAGLTVLTPTPSGSSTPALRSRTNSFDIDTSFPRFSHTLSKILQHAPSNYASSSQAISDEDLIATLSIESSAADSLTPDRTPRVSRPSSGMGGAPIDINELSQVPGYDIAVRTCAQPLSESLPPYSSATASDCAKGT
ncbi:Arrestin domain-containing protein [Neolecta irregularis DAH-3]|uniref:Arrestin domain-containing protein n=1 Tax=Neolecta irregularis (strain DAH-3) TaxID=1198029 RepID=A0A1U7LW80_NEOID|nr:Arrestin domain-containing protein [Neolecta irregularis DAH-3]|eukprot:OLL26761.1 Arrestin domain-containing protein [Neolecta irregularis DAH-3]